MSLNSVINADRLQIGFFGKRNAGKSSVVNAITGQNLSIVSDVAGTTTDPVQKAMEILPIGPVLIIDTPGYDDEGILGTQRVEKTKQILNRIDAAVIVVDGTIGVGDTEKELINLMTQREVPYIIVFSKLDLMEVSNMNYMNKSNSAGGCSENIISVSALEGTNIHELKEMMGRWFAKESEEQLISDLINEHEYALLVVPIDTAAPKGRIILPQQKVIRDILDSDAKAIVVKENELKGTLNEIGIKPSLVITDSQVFEKVAAIVPECIPLTSFSIIMARYNGFLDIAMRGAGVLSSVGDDDTILIAEGCTHHRQCGDIGSVKLPAWIRRFTGHNPSFEFTSGGTFPEDTEKYKLIIHCGACMLNKRQVHYRMKCAEYNDTAVTNYGIAIAYMKGILDRSAGWIAK